MSVDAKESAADLQQTDRFGREENSTLVSRLASVFDAHTSNSSQTLCARALERFEEVAGSGSSVNTPLTMAASIVLKLPRLRAGPLDATVMMLIRSRRMLQKVAMGAE